MAPTDNKYYRFDQNFHVPEDVDIDQINGKLDEGRLKLTMPKKGIKEEIGTNRKMQAKYELLPDFIVGAEEEDGMMERFIENVQKNKRFITVAAVACVVGFYVARKL